MPVSPLEIDDVRRRQPKFPKSLIFVFIGLLLAAIGFQFMDVGREYRLYTPIRDRIGHLSLAALKDKFSSNPNTEKTTATSATTSGEEEKNRDPPIKQEADPISENFRVTNMELPTLFNLILEPYGEEARQARVHSRPTLLYDLSFLNVSSSMKWDLMKSPLKQNSFYPVSIADERGGSSGRKSKNSGKKAGRKQRSGSG